jgi:putative PIN family toxin of toxin-antitoxin system
MRIVVDTNVFVSAALKDKSSPAIAVRIVQAQGTLLKSSPTEAQFHEVLARPYLAPLISSAALDWLQQLIASAEMVSITKRIVACRDPTDDKFLELAVSGHADLIVSGDTDLLVLNPFQGIPIVAAAAFVQSTIRA